MRGIGVNPGGYKGVATLPGCGRVVGVKWSLDEIVLYPIMYRNMG